MSLADLSVGQINRSLAHAAYLKRESLALLQPTAKSRKLASTSLHHKSIALLFSKRSTRTRLAAETGAALLGGRALFLGKEDIQLGVNESAEDTAKVIGSMCQGIFARVGEHEEIEVSLQCSRDGPMFTFFCFPAGFLGTRTTFPRPRPKRTFFPLAPNANPRGPTNVA